MPTKDSPFPPKLDTFTKFGATLLASHINSVWLDRKRRNPALWRDKGYGEVIAEPYQSDNSSAWFVRSNLVNGLPPVVKERRAATTRSKMEEVA